MNIVIKPLAGAGSADTYRVDDLTAIPCWVACNDCDTYRVDDLTALDQVIEQVRHVQSLSVEEYIEGGEYTFDTVCADGKVVYENIAWYRLKPMIGRAEEWISMQTVNLRHVDEAYLQAGRKLGHAVLKALGFRTGFTHTEWFLKPDGEAVFGEIGGRPPGGRSVDLMNYSNDFDIYTGCGEAVTSLRFSQLAHRAYHAAAIFKRTQGQGHIHHIEGLETLRRRFGDALVHVDLLPLGAQRRNWKQTLIPDGYLIVRHPDLETPLEMADIVGTDLKIYAG